MALGTGAVCRRVVPGSNHAAGEGLLVDEVTTVPFGCQGQVVVGGRESASGPSCISQVSVGVVVDEGQAVAQIGETLRGDFRLVYDARIFHAYSSLVGARTEVVLPPPISPRNAFRPFETRNLASGMNASWT